MEKWNRFLSVTPDRSQPSLLGLLKQVWTQGGVDHDFSLILFYFVHFHSLYTIQYLHKGPSLIEPLIGIKQALPYWEPKSERNK